MVVDVTVKLKKKVLLEDEERKEKSDQSKRDKLFLSLLDKDKNNNEIKKIRKKITMIPGNISSGTINYIQNRIYNSYDKLYDQIRDPSGILYEFYELKNDKDGNIKYKVKNLENLIISLKQYFPKITKDTLTYSSLRTHIYDNYILVRKEEDNEYPEFLYYTNRENYRVLLDDRFEYVLRKKYT